MLNCAMAALKWHRIIAVWPLLGMDSGVHPMSLIIHRASSLSSLRFQLYGKEEDTAANRGESIMRQRRNFAWNLGETLYPWQYTYICV